MADFVSQARWPSTNRRTTTRTDYLEGHRKTAVTAIQEYLEVPSQGENGELRPDRGEEVTLAVLNRIGTAEIREVAKKFDVSFDTAKQDLGLFVVKLLVERYGPDNVLTYRGPDGRSVSTRRVDLLRWPHLKDVSKFTPHRVNSRGELPIRIILDTSLIPRSQNQDGQALDIASLCVAKGKHPVSLADGAIPELVHWFINGTGDFAPFPRWPAIAEQLDQILDKDMPIAPGGHERAAMSRLRDFDPGYSEEGTREYSRMAWQYLRGLRTTQDLSHQPTFDTRDGHKVRLNFCPPDGPLRTAGAKWAEFITRIGALYRTTPGALAPKEEDLIAAIRASVVASKDLTPESAGRLDLVLYAMARRARDAGAGKYAPKPSVSNLAIDFDLLFYVALPAVVCVRDNGFVNFVRSLKCGDTDHVMTQPELLAWLKTGKWPLSE